MRKWKSRARLWMLVVDKRNVCTLHIDGLFTSRTGLSWSAWCALAREKVHRLDVYTLCTWQAKAHIVCNTHKHTHISRIIIENKNYASAGNKQQQWNSTAAERRRIYVFRICERCVYSVRSLHSARNKYTCRTLWESESDSGTHRERRKRAHFTNWKYVIIFLSLSGLYTAWCTGIRCSGCIANDISIGIGPASL